MNGQEREPSALKRITDTVAGFITVPSEAGLLRIGGQAFIDAQIVTKMIHQPPQDTKDWAIVGGTLILNRFIIRFIDHMLKRLP